MARHDHNKNKYRASLIMRRSLGWQRQRILAGFTLVEVLVTIVITTIFIGVISQLYITQAKIGSTMTAYNTADLLAYNNMRTYAYGKAPNWFSCTYTGSVPDAKTMLSSSAAVPGIPAPVSQTVVATAPYGCGGGAYNGYPIRVVSTVTYGPQGKVVVHATYATY